MVLKEITDREKVVMAINPEHVVRVYEEKGGATIRMIDGGLIETKTSYQRVVEYLSE
jgi:hypothetical protein